MNGAGMRRGDFADPSNVRTSTRSPPGHCIPDAWPLVNLGRNELFPTTALRAAAQTNCWQRCRGAYRHGHARIRAMRSYLRYEVHGPRTNPPPHLRLPIAVTVIPPTTTVTPSSCVYSERPISSHPHKTLPHRTTIFPRRFPPQYYLHLRTTRTLNALILPTTRYDSFSNSGRTNSTAQTSLRRLENANYRLADRLPNRSSHDDHKLHENLSNPLIPRHRLCKRQVSNRQLLKPYPYAVHLAIIIPRKSLPIV